MIKECLKKDVKEISKTVFPIYVSLTVLSFFSILLNKTLIDSSRFAETHFYEILSSISSILLFLSGITMLFSFFIVAYVFAQDYQKSISHCSRVISCQEPKKEKAMRKTRFFITSLWLFIFLVTLILFIVSFKIFGTTGFSSPVNKGWLNFFTNTLLLISDFIDLNNVLFVIGFVLTLFFLSCFYSTLSLLSASAALSLFKRKRRFNLPCTFILLNMAFLLFEIIYFYLYAKYIVPSFDIFNGAYITLFLYSKTVLYILLAILFKHFANMLKAK